MSEIEIKNNFRTYRNAQGQVHNEDGPAVISTDGYEAWLINDKTHRENGPARIFSDGRNFWLLEDKRVL